MGTILLRSTIANTPVRYKSVQFATVSIQDGPRVETHGAVS